MSTSDKIPVSCEAATERVSAGWEQLHSNVKTSMERLTKPTKEPAVRETGRTIYAAIDFLTQTQDSRGEFTRDIYTFYLQNSEDQKLCTNPAEAWAAAHEIGRTLEQASDGVLEYDVIDSKDTSDPRIESPYRLCIRKVNPLDNITVSLRTNTPVIDRDKKNVRRLYQLGIITDTQIYEAGEEVDIPDPYSAVESLEKTHNHQGIKIANFIINEDRLTPDPKIYGDLDVRVFDHQKFAMEVVQQIQKQYPNPATLMLKMPDALTTYLYAAGNSPNKVYEYMRSLRETLHSIYGKRFEYYMTIKDIASEETN